MLKLLWQTCCFQWARLSFFKIVIKVTITRHKQRKFLLFWMPLRRTLTFWPKIDHTHSYWPTMCFLILKQIGFTHKRQRNIIQDCYMNCCWEDSLRFWFACLFDSVNDPFWYLSLTTASIMLSAILDGNVKYSGIVWCILCDIWWYYEIFGCYYEGLICAYDLLVEFAVNGFCDSRVIHRLFSLRDNGV